MHVQTVARADGTHSLGPLLCWFGGDRITRVSCAHPGSHYTDDAGEPYISDGAVMLCQTESGGLMKIRLDLVSNQPGGQRHLLQGTRGTFELDSSGEPARIWLQAEEDSQPSWAPLSSVGLDSPRTLDNAEMLRQFVGACRGECDNPLDVHVACDLTLPGLVSEQSVEEDGRWVAVPDSREWTRQARM